jgi:hypothetical protein
MVYQPMPWPPSQPPSQGPQKPQGEHVVEASWLWAAAEHREYIEHMEDRMLMMEDTAVALEQALDMQFDSAVGVAQAIAQLCGSDG